jgi:hypothetical protein
LRNGEVRRGAEKVGVPGFAGARLAGKNSGKGPGGLTTGFIGCCTSRKALEGGLDSREVVEGVEAVGTAAQLTRSLWTAEHEEAEHGGLVAAEIEDGANPVLVFWDTRVADRANQGEVFKGMESLANLFFGEVEDGVSARALVARVKQSVEGERVVLWRSDFFFDQRAEHPELDGIKLHRY